MTEINFNNLNNRYKQARVFTFKSNNPQENQQQSIPQGLIPDVQTTIPQPQPQVQQEQTQLVQIPDIYYMPKDDGPKNLKEIVKQVDMMGMISPWFENPLLMGGTAVGLSMGIDKFANSFGGEYEKSILGKATALGDRIENSEFIKKPGSQKILKKVNSGINRINNLLNKSALIRAMRNTPAEAEWQMPRSELIPQKVRILEDLHHITGTLELSTNKFIQVKNLGLDKTEKQLLKEYFKKSRISQINPNDVVNWTLLKRLEVPEEEIKKILAKGEAALPEVKSRVLKQLGFTVEELADIRIHPEKYLNRVKDSMLKTGKKVKIGAGHFGILGPFQLFERSISCDQIGNKLRSIMDPNISKTGKVLAKTIQKVYRGFTFGGGKLGMCLWIAPSVLMMLKDTVKAGWDEKIGTFVNGSFEAISWVFTFPLSIATMYALAGMEFAGMSKDQVAKYRELVKNFNDDVLKGTYKDFASYRKAKKAIKAQLKALKKDVGPQNLFTKAVRKIWSTLNMDLGMMKPFQGKNPITNLLHKIPNSLKNCFGVPLRFIICMFAVEGFYRSVIEKGSRALFGRHYDHMKHEEHDMKKKEQKKFLKEDLQKRLYEAQAAKNENAANPQSITNTQNIQPTQQQNEINPVNIFEEKPVTSTVSTVSPSQPNTAKTTTEPIVQTNNTAIDAEKNITNNKTNSATRQIKPQETQQVKEKIDNYTYIPSSENVIKQQKETLENKYIPSQEGIKLTNTFDNSHLADALNRADRAEQRALQILSGNFDGM